MNANSCAAQAECCGNKTRYTREGLRRGLGRRELKERGRGMKDRVDKSMGIATIIAEALAKIKPTEPLRFANVCGDVFFPPPVVLAARVFA
jgi:hypothetical protein